MRLLLHWDPEIDGDFRRTFEAALDNLRIPHDDASAVDETPPDAIPVALASPTSARETKDALLIVAGPGEAKPNGHLRLEAADITDNSRRWQGVVDKLAHRLDRRALVPYVAADNDLATLKAWALEHPADPLAETVHADFDVNDLRARLARETQRADTAEARLRDHERWLNDTKRGEGQAVGLKREAEIEAAGLRADLAEAHARLGEAAAMLESTAFPPSRIPADVRELCMNARREAGLARVMGERAEAMAQEAPDTLSWTNARYAGETRNRMPHGLGVMTYLDGRNAVGAYSGQFEAGLRSGLGIGSNEGLTWSGRWTNDEAHGPGVLDARDGRRFEGDVATTDGHVRRQRGHLWRDTPTLRHGAVPPVQKQLTST